MIYTKTVKYIGLLFLICGAFYYTEKVIDVSIEQDEIMQTIKNKVSEYTINPINAIINEDTIIPGKVGKTIDLNKSYQNMRKIGNYQESLLSYIPVYPEVSINNNYNHYIINGNPYYNNISLIYIITNYNDNLIDSLLTITNNNNTPITFFIDSTYLSNNLTILKKIENYEIYNYGNMGKYTKDALIITNNIITNKTSNSSSYCIFLKKNSESLNNCANFKMHSIIPQKISSITSNLQNGAIFLINNTKSISQTIDYIKGKGYKIVPLSQNIIE